MSAITPSPAIGRSLPRLEAREKVTGRVEYTHHLKLPGMLHGKIFRSTVPHAKIKRIDTSAAAALPGVFQVVTILEVLKVMADQLFASYLDDHPILADVLVGFF
jgi:CO/xanthine dehydrogenase Mo-binding subunit